MSAQAAPSERDLDRLANLARNAERLLVLTGAGVSTASGIPDYRDEDGEWKRSAPMQFADFKGNERSRRRYWARSMIGWPRVQLARPNAAHATLAQLEQQGHVHQLVTQNVDGLHQRAGSRNVIDMHGRLDDVCCLSCDYTEARDSYQDKLIARNAAWTGLDAGTAPDGDADLEVADFDRFKLVPCPVCGGIIKPRVVFYGESIPGPVTRAANAALADADALLVVGSSLMVFSGFRFARSMAERGQPVAAINRGKTRADELIGLKIQADIAPTLGQLAQRLDAV
ncbi:MAG: NAD-dependent protein deacetylase [Pseudomonadota bacterium]